MKLLRSKTSEPGQEVAKKVRGGRALVIYFLPVVLVGMVLVGVVSVFVQQALSANQRDLAASSASIIAAAVVERISGVLQSKQDMLLLMARQGRLADKMDALAEGGPLDLDAEALRDLPGFLRVRLFPVEWQTPLPDGVAPIGYAGLDMIRKAAQTGHRQIAEVHQISTGKPYVATAVPVVENDKVRGVLFGAMSAKVIKRVVSNAPVFPGRIWLVQGGGTGFTLASGLDGEGESATGTLPVDGSVWKLHFQAEPKEHPLNRSFVLQGLLIGGVAAMLLTLVLIIRLLSRDLRQDQASMVALGEAILGGEGATSPKPRIAANRDALILLTQYAKEALANSKQRRVVMAPAPAIEETVEDASQPPADDRLPPVGASPPPVSREALERAAATTNLPASLFRAYDIRGVYGDTLTPAIAHVAGQAIGTLAIREAGSRVVVGRDARTSSPDLAKSLVEGLLAAGCEVSDIGLVPTPVLYHALEKEGMHAGIMVTGSHNPPQYNGFKIVVNGLPLDGGRLQALRRLMLSGDFNEGKGKVSELDVVPAYVTDIAERLQVDRTLKVVVDAGNGAAGEAAKLVFQALGCEVIPLFCEPDGTFPNHHPDPSQPDNLAALMVEVQAQSADLGIAFDGDGDRVGLVDNHGAYIWPDQVLMLLAADILVRNPGADILFDIKSSKHIAGYLLANGGRPIMWKAGHTLMKSKLRETGALLAGEFSGHYYIKERWYGFDDGIFTAARVIELLSTDPRDVSDVFAELPQSPSTPEIHLDVGEGKGPVLIQALAKHMAFDDAKIIDLDGIRVEFPEGWGLVRASNTTPTLMFRFEAETEASLDAIKSRFRELLKKVVPDARAPF